MARKIVETITDDIDGSPEAKNVTFAIDGMAYEIDLSEAHTTKLRSVLAPFVAVARKVNGSTPRAGRRGYQRPTPKIDRERAADIRAWAKAHGLTVSERGRISASVVSKYEAAH